MTEEIVLSFYKNVKSLIVLYMFGFFVGNIYANVFLKDYVTSLGIFSEYFFSHYLITGFNEKQYLFYLFRLRLIPAIVLCAASVTKARRIIVFIFLIWTGFLCGIVVAAAIIKMGIVGSIYSILIVFPHMIVYFAAYILLAWNIGRYHKIKQNYLRYVIIFFLICIGILTECYINPLLIKMFLKTI